MTYPLYVPRMTFFATSLLTDKITASAGRRNQKNCCRKNHSLMTIWTAAYLLPLKSLSIARGGFFEATGPNVFCALFHWFGTLFSANAFFSCFPSMCSKHSKATENVQKQQHNSPSSHKNSESNIPKKTLLFPNKTIEPLIDEVYSIPF